MEIETVISRNREHIWQALSDYGAHTSSTAVMDDATPDFVDNLARDNAYAKAALREMFSKSPVWDDELDALVINGTRTHNPDRAHIHNLASQILFNWRQKADYKDRVLLDEAIQYFLVLDDEYPLGVEAIKMLAPKAYAPGKKRSRIFKALCIALGIADETAGSEFQHLFAQFADELTSRKIGFKLFVSVNPAHFITMSNPKNDQRGSTLTSCHSFNSTDYEYNTGCTGYARDNTSFIVFTVDDPTDRETLNNRKTTRQIFAYKPGNGVLLQSRMYDTSGGTRGAQEESKLYRDLVQREISFCEEAPNLWKTYPSDHGDHAYLVEEGDGFGGYPDWTYDDFDGHISVRHDHAENCQPIEVGTYGLCVHCGCETNHGVYCEDCCDGDRCETNHGVYCEDCCDGDRCDCCGAVMDSDYLYTVYDRNGNEQYVCQDCRDRYYTYCDECERYVADECVHRTVDGDYVCDSCLDNYYTECCECGDYVRNDDSIRVIRQDGQQDYVCEQCYRDVGYVNCELCDDPVHPDAVVEAFDRNSRKISICPECAADFKRCSLCGTPCDEDALENGLCPECQAENEREEIA